MSYIEEARTKYPKSVKALSSGNILKPGSNNKKLGYKITKVNGRGKGFTLSL